LELTSSLLTTIAFHLLSENIFVAEPQTAVTVKDIKCVASDTFGTVLCDKFQRLPAAPTNSGSWAVTAKAFIGFAEQTKFAATETGKVVG
jgi:hypothetical protein